MAEEMERLKPEVETPLTELDNHLGRKIRLLTRTATTHIGFLKEVHSHRISVGRSRGEQGLTYEISLHDIRELRDRPPLPAPPRPARRRPRAPKPSYLLPVAA